MELWIGLGAVADKLVRLYGMGIRHVVTSQNFGLMPAQSVRRSMELMAREVLPLALQRIAQDSPPEPAGKWPQTLGAGTS